MLSPVKYNLLVATQSIYLFSKILTFNLNCYPKYEAKQLCRYSNFLQAGQSWDRIPTKREILTCICLSAGGLLAKFPPTVDVITRMRNT